jgi:hypothetical protein
MPTGGGGPSGAGFAERVAPRRFACGCGNRAFWPGAVDSAERFASKLVLPVQESLKGSIDYLTPMLQISQAEEDSWHCLAFLLKAGLGCSGSR